MRMDRFNRNTWLGLGLLAILVFLGLSAIGGGMMGHEFARGYPNGYGGRFWDGGPWMWGFGIFGLFVRVVLWGALIALAIGFFRRLMRRSDAEMGETDLSPLEILKRRYAAGEITREQYDEMRRVVEPTG